MTTAGEDQIKDNMEDEQTFRNVRQWLIKRISDSHFEVIKKMENLVEELKKEADNEKRPTYRKNLENRIRRTEIDILNLKQKTPEVLKQIDVMQRELDSEMK